MKQRVYHIICDNGDGSSTVEFFVDKDRVEALVSDEGPDEYTCNEGVVRHFDIDGEHNISIQHGGC